MSPLTASDIFNTGNLFTFTGAIVGTRLGCFAGKALVSDIDELGRPGNMYLKYFVTSGLSLCYMAPLVALGALVDRDSQPGRINGEPSGNEALAAAACIVFTQLAITFASRYLPKWSRLK